MATHQTPGIGTNGQPKVPTAPSVPIHQKTYEPPQKVVLTPPKQG